MKYSLMVNYRKRSNDVSIDIEKFQDIVGIDICKIEIDLEHYSNELDKAIDIFKKCKRNECFIGLKSESEGVKITISKFKESCSVAAVFKCDVMQGKEKFFSVLEWMETIFNLDNPSSVFIEEISDIMDKVNRDRSIKHPSSFLGITGSEWYVRLSKENWSNHYTEEVIMNAPFKPKKNSDGSVEWFSYKSLFNPEEAKIRAVVEYLGNNKSDSILAN